jgi:proline dehydrogenase
MSFFRNTILGLADNKVITKVFTKYGMNFGVSRFIAGETRDKALKAVHALNKEGLMVSLDYLGESIESHEKAKEATEFTVNLLEAIDNANVTSNVSVKLTHFGLDIDREFCLENMHRITNKAKEKNNFVRIDMEDSTRIDDTLYILEQLLNTYGRNHIGAVIQSYLYRSEEDVLRLGEKDVNLRILKGAYQEPREVAFQQKEDVDKNYIHLVQLHLNNGHYTAIATHDDKIIYTLKNWIHENHIPKDLYEFQMLYGIRITLQRSLVQEGYRVRTYTPFGKDWYAYFSRRIAERPANTLFVLKNLFNK